MNLKNIFKKAKPKYCQECEAIGTTNGSVSGYTIPEDCTPAQ